ncbi:MAG: acyl-CoA dehydrogenase family protein [Streptosporangiaceae bacterium]
MPEDLGGGGFSLSAANYNVVEGAKEVVDLALRATGGAAFFKNNELERLYRDVRAGGFHPPTPTLCTI